MKSIRKRNPLVFDATLLVGFIAIAFLAYTLASESDQTGALVGLIGLAIICVVLVISR